MKYKHDYISALEEHGFARLGGGLYSTVLAKPGSDRCIKVGSGDRWPDYVEWAATNGYMGTFAPKVYAFKQHDSFYVAVMERLVCTVAEAGQRAETHHFWRQAKAIVRPYFDYDDMLEAGPWLSFLSAIKAAGLADDVHDHNWMLRRDGQLVLIDPISSYPDGPSSLRIKNGLTVATKRSTVDATQPQNLSCFNV